MVKESQMLQPLVSGLLDSGFWDSEDPASIQVPFGQKRIDVAAHVAGEVIAIELKVKNWKRALYQAFINQLGADKVYVAIWESYASEELLEEANDLGIGIILVSRNGSIALSSSVTSGFFSILRRKEICDFIYSNKRTVGELLSQI